MTVNKEDALEACLQAVNARLGGAMTLVLTPASLRWRMIASSADSGLGDDPIRAGVGGEAPDLPVPAGGLAASLCLIMGRPPSHVWWCPLPRDRLFVIYWTGAPDCALAELNGAALEVVRVLPDIDPDDRDARDILLNVIDALTTGLIYHDDGGRRIIANQAGRRVLGLGDGVITMRSATTALTRFCGSEPGAASGNRLDVERDGRTYQVRSEDIQFAFGSGVLWRIEDVTGEVQRRARLAEAKRVALMADVAGGVGHQFNNLLARVICQAEAVQDATSTTEARTLAEQIIETSEAGATVVRHLMTYAGGAVIDCVTVDLAALIQGWVRGVAQTPAIAIEGCQGLVTADYDLLRGSLDELHSNALRAGATELRLRCVSGPSGTIALEFIDNGEGMTATDCIRAPDPFFTRNAVGEGTGLGLSMVKGAMRQCGGDMVISSGLGEGTTVTLCLVTAEEGV